MCTGGFNKIVEDYFCNKIIIDMESLANKGETVEGGGGSQEHEAMRKSHWIVHRASLF